VVRLLRTLGCQGNGADRQLNSEPDLRQPECDRLEKSALVIIERLSPEESIDPETLGIAGAIRRRLWESDRPARAHLDAAAKYYGRGFEVRGDYYNGENYALCLDLRTKVQTEVAEATYDRMTAQKVRLRVRETLGRELAEAGVAERVDLRWMLATMSNIARTLDDAPAADAYETRFRALGRPQWEVDTFEAGKRYAEALAAERN
jgi:MAP3K TRAFs-binding domain